MKTNRRDFVRELGLSAAALPFVAGLPSLNGAEPPVQRQRIIFLFSPNGTIPPAFWPDKRETEEDFELKKILQPLAAWQQRMLILKGVCNKVQGDGDRHMRGMSCLLTGKELFPGNIQGGSDTPAGWCQGISIDQEIKNFLQAKEATRTRFGSLEFGVGVPDRADPWTRMSYAGPNQPIAPLDLYAMQQKLYGGLEDRESLVSVLDTVREDLKRVQTRLAPEDRALLERHAQFVQDMERQMKQAGDRELAVAAPTLKPGLSDDRNENLPEICRLQTELLVNAFANDMARVATFQLTKSVGQARMRWLGIEDGHHGLSHHPDQKQDSQQKLVKINVWVAEQIAALLTRLEETPEPAGEGTLLDHTTVVWVNELGKGNSHTLDDIPFVMIGGGLGFRTGRSLQYEKLAHNRLLMSLARGFGHELESFGNPRLSQGGALDLG